MHFEPTVNPNIHAGTIEEFSFLTTDRLDIHVPASSFPALIKIKLELCLEEAKKRTNEARLQRGRLKFNQ
jgi:hypothetical protein